jgi:hypothetical protein
MTFAEEIEELAAPESIQAVIIGPFGWSDDINEAEPFGSDEIERPTPARRGVKLTWDEARPMLNYEYHRGYGSPGCDAIWAYTPTRIIFVWKYDGATGLSAVPRDPHDGVPEMYGGG